MSGSCGGAVDYGCTVCDNRAGTQYYTDRLLRSVRRTVRCRRAADVREVRSLILHVVRQRIRFVYRVVAASMSLVGRAIRAQQHVREISMLALHVLQQAIGCAWRARHVREISMLELNVLRQAIGYARRARHVREVSMLALNVLRQAIGGAQRVAAGPTSLVGRAIRVRHVRQISMLALNVLRQAIGCARRVAAAGPTSLVGRAIRAQSVVLAKLRWCRALLHMIRYVGAAAGEAAAATRAPDGIW